MNVSFSPVSGSTVRPALRASAETITRHASTESQSLPPDHFETSSQCLAISDRSEIGEDFWERQEAQIEAPDSERSEQLNFFDSIQLNLSDTEDNYLDTLLKTRQPARQAATTPNPFLAALAPQASLPTPPEQEERTSRHELFQGVPASEETDKECESPDDQVRRKARTKLGMRKTRRTRERKLGTTARLELEVKQRQAMAKRKGFTNDAEYQRYLYHKRRALKK
jgi:hypothetical protein